MSFTSQDSTQSNETFGKDASFTLPQLIGSMSISPAGRDVVLGSKEGLHIIDLDSPYSPPRFLPHRTPWEVADVQWSPFADRDYWVVSTSNQKALVWNLNMVGWRNSIEHVLHGHTRAITDINFSAHHPDKLATCSVDSFVHCWDLRCPGRPVTSFSDWFAGATQVKWSRQDEHVLASSHDKFLHIWDDRKCAYPARTIEAHDTKIYGIDWNRFEPSKMVTCSLDKTIKFWDTNQEANVPDRVIKTDFPVWRARHTPYGWGLMVMPQRGNGNLHLYDRRAVNGVHDSGAVKPVHVFPGHKGQVKEFLWRAFGTVKDGIDHRDFQLVSWGTDRELRLHAVPENVFTDVGYEKGISKPQRLRFTRRGARYRTFRDEPREQDAVLAAPPRADSFPASNQCLRVRGRPSTNMGMSRVPVTQFKGWLQTGKNARRTDMHGKASGRPDTDPISWMKNVKIASWDTDALADEITSVGEKFKKVDFETVDVSQRKATMSLESPWGDPDSATVYTRIDLKFPKAYPKDARAIVHVQRTSSITAETQKKLMEDIQNIAEAHKAKGRGCIEAIVRYLLKEQTLDQIISWLMRDSLTDSKILEAVDIAQDVSDDSDDDQVGSVPKVAHKNQNVNVPLAKGCAAIWAENGKLVCFFRPKNKEPTSFLSTIGTGQLDESDSSKLFGGFGKFQIDSPARKAKDIIAQGPDDSDPEHSDHSSVSSSSTSSSDSSGVFEVGTNRFVPWQRTTLDSLQRDKSAEGSQKSTTLDGTRVDDASQPTVIAIHDLSGLLPASEAAALGYQINDSIKSTCEHNGAVAERCSLSTAANAWNLLESLLATRPSQQVQRTLKVNPEPPPAQFLRPTLAGGDAFRESPHEKEPDKTWLEDLLRTTRLAYGIMQHFDRTADVQMLAMLSAIYLQTQLSFIQHLERRAMQHPAKDRSQSSERAHVTQALRNVQDRRLDPRNGVYEQGPRPSRSDGPGYPHAELSTSMPTSTLATNYVGNTQQSSGAPNVVAQDPSGFVSAIHSSATSLAGSPESHRFSRKSDSLVAGQPRAKPRLPSPPVRSAHRASAQHHRSSKSLRASPDDNFFNEARSRLKTSLSLANVSGYTGDNNQRQNTGGHLRKLRNDGAETPLQQPRKRKLKTKIHAPSLNAEVDDSLLHSSMPSEEVLRQCLSHVRQYMNLLEAWQMWPQRAEMNKLCSQASIMLDKLINGRSSSNSSVEARTGLEVRRCCPECGSTLAPIEKNGVAIGWHCISQECHKQHRKVSKKQRCSICDMAVHGLSLPCLQCGHLVCYECAQGWYGHQSVEERKRSNSTTLSKAYSVTADEAPGCPTGCGCSCSSLSEITVPYPDNAPTEPDQDVALVTPHSEGYTDSTERSLSLTQHRSHRGQSTGATFGAPESAFNALLALQGQSRHRSTSSTHTASTAVGPSYAQQISQSTSHATRTRDNSISTADELLPWASDRNPTLGRGLGGGLSRGLSNKGSDSTIRKAARGS